ncbi:MAG: CPBP family intramembrane glutamic endopeptidase [Rhodothermales bacterium]
MTWIQRDVAQFVIILMAVSVFSLYWFVSSSKAFDARVRQRIDPAGIKKPLAQKYLGTLLLGGLPALLVWMLMGKSPSEWGLGVPDWQATLVWGSILSLCALPVPYFSARARDMQAFYPQVRAMEWNGQLVAQNGLAWMIYLLAYEFLFRGLLVIGSASLSNPWTAVALSSALATATHIPKGAKETFATVPYSLLLGFVALETGSVWAGYLSHICLAIANDYWAVLFNPEMRFVREGARSRVGAPMP